MPILELTLLRTKPPTLPTDPKVLTSLQTVRALLTSRIHPTNSRFYTPTSPSPSTSNPSEIYILGSWPSVTAHQDFLSSPLKNEILAPQEDVLEFGWGMHVEIGEGERVPDAPVLGIMRVKGEEWGIVGRWRRLVEEAMEMKTYAVFGGRRCDEGESETVVITGWASEGEYEAVREKARGVDEEIVGGNGVSFVLVRDLEA